MRKKTLFKKHYVYIHLNPFNNEIFYVGEGKGNRKTNKSSRNKKWHDYVSKLSGHFKVLVLKDNLSKLEALELEKKVIKKIDWYYNDLTTNITGSESNLDNDIVIQFNFENLINTKPENKSDFKPRFENLTNEDIIKSLLDFPNENKLSEIKKEFDLIYDSFYENYDELEEVDEDIFLDIENVLTSINDLIDEYKVSDKANISEFISDLKRERLDVDFILEDRPKRLQKEFTKKILNWIDNNLHK